MSHDFVPVQWNKQKVVYDLILIFGMVNVFLCFVGVGYYLGAADVAILIMRGLGVCAILMLHIVLAIGPLARLSDRFKPLLYNRRHFGVLLALIALAHGAFSLMWYHGSGVINPLASAIGGYGDYGVPIDFPFESFGVFALIILLIMASTSHDFWLSRLRPPVWKAIHMSVYVAYIALVAHVAWGTVQFDKGYGLITTIAIGAIGLSGLHVLAMLKGLSLDAKADKRTERKTGWIKLGNPMEIPFNKAITVTPKNGERIAIFRHAKGLSAIDAVCSHQNGPLGEGCLIGGLITCPWHGFQFDPETGEAPAPFEDKVRTHEVKVEGGKVWVKAEADPFGTVRKSVEVPS